MGTITITVLMTDIVDSTRLHSLGTDLANRVLQEHLDVVRTAIARHNGREVKCTGDGVMAAFTSAVEAVRAAEAIQRTTCRLQSQDSRRPQVRVGISTGEASYENGDWFGAPVIEAARLVAADQADGGEVLATGIVAMLARGDGRHQFTSVGDRVLKGFEEAVSVWRLDWRDAKAPQVPLPPACTGRADPFVGRDVDRRRLLEAWERSRNSGWELALVAGEPGIGKTRLVAEVATEMHDRGASVLWGRCDEDLDIPFQPFTEALRHWYRHDPEFFASAAPPPVAILIPELAEQGLGYEPVGEPDLERLQLFDAVGALLSAGSEQAPVVLVLDDMQWAGTPTISMLRHLFNDSRSGRVVAMATYRDTDLSRTHPLAAALADLRRETHPTRVVLRGLDVEGVRDLVGHALAHQSQADWTDLATLVHEQTAGNPFFVGELVRHLTESGEVSTPADLETSLPEGIRDVVGRRLSRLPEGADRVLALAAVIGHQFSLGLLEAAADAADRERALEWLEVAAGAGLIEEVAGRPGTWSFVHAIVRHTVLSELAAARRARIHRKIAQTLAGLPDPDSVLVSHHFAGGASAGSVTEAAEWAVRAADSLSANLAAEEAMAVIERALRILELEEPVNRQLRGRLLIRLAELYGWPAAEGKRLSLEAAADARAVGDAEVLAEAALARVGWPIAGTPDPEGRRLLEEALEITSPQDLVRRAQLLNQLASYRSASEGEGTRVDDLAREAIALARQSGDDAVISNCVANFAVTHVGLPNLAELNAIAAECRERAATASRLWGLRLLMIAIRTEVVTRLQSGDLAGSKEAAVEIAMLERPALRRQHLQPAGAFELMWATMHALAEGRLDDAAVANSALPEAAAGDANFVNSWGAQLFRIERARGRVADLVPVLESLVEQTPGLVALRSLLALALVDIGNLDRAREVINDVLEYLPVDTTRSAALADLAEVYAALDDADSAAVLHEHLMEYEGQQLVVAWGVACLGAADSYLGLLDTVLGRLDEAAAHFERGLAMEARGAPALVARTRRWQEALSASRRSPAGRARG